MKPTSLLLPGVVLASTAFAVYLNTLPAQFTFDDNFAVISNGDVSDPNKPLVALFRNDFWGQDLSSPMSHKSYRPFTVLSFRVQRIVGQFFFRELRAEYVKRLEAEGKHDNSRGLDPLMFHLSNVTAHSLVTVLVFRLALRLCASRRRHFTQAVPWTLQDLTEAFVAALLFAVHPVHTEAVAGIVGHAEMLCAALSILALLSYMEAADGRVPDLASHWGHVAVAVALGWCAALTKEIGITIMGAMACYDLLVAPLTMSFQPSRAANKGEYPQPSRHRSRPGAGKQQQQQQQGSVSTAARASAGAAAALQGSSAGAAGAQHGLGLKLLRLLATAVGLVIYVKARSLLAGDQLVRIYRRVENPIPFSPSSLERKLTTGYLHARYFGLLVAPAQLSADWSYACIDYVSSLRDPRNAATLAVYLLLLATLLLAQPWRVLAQWAGKRPDEPSPKEHARRWRLAVLTGLVVAPYFPASNVLFYVGTFIGERLMYFPSVGFCILVAEWLAPPLAPLVEAFQEQGLQKVLSGRAGLRKYERKTLAAAGLLATVVTLFTLKTVVRNADWYDEERLFRAAQKVCWRSAKVQLNSGILERRYQNWDAAIEHFRLAAEVDPTYCEPDYHIGVTLITGGKSLPAGVDLLEKSISCKYTAADSLKALNQVFAALAQDPNTGPATVGARWAKVLALPALKRYGEALNYCEQTAAIYAKAGHEDSTQSALDTCQEMLDKAEPSVEGRTPDFPLRASAPPELLETLQHCFKARRPVVLAIARAAGSTPEDRLNATSVKAAAYRYITRAAPECRHPLPVNPSVDPGSEDYQQRSNSFHTELMHTLQKADAADAWLQREWAETMLARGRASDGLLHAEVAGQLLRGLAGELLQGRQVDRLGLDGQPLTLEAAIEGALGAFQRGLEFATRPEVAGGLQSPEGRVIRADCILQLDMCAVFQALSSAPALSPADQQQAAGKMADCLHAARRLGCPLGDASRSGQPLEKRAMAADADEEEEEGEEEDAVEDYEGEGRATGAQRRSGVPGGAQHSREDAGQGGAGAGAEAGVQHGGEL